MGDCKWCLYHGHNAKDRFCTYSEYMCCERMIPRRRSRSETNEYCRRKSKEMKTYTPKKCSSTQYENMDFEYDIEADYYDTNRKRANLCELPTTYISGNQLSNMGKVSMSKESGNFTECLKTVKRNDKHLKFMDYNHQTHFGVAMQEKNNIKQDLLDHIHRLHSSKMDHLRSHYGTQIGAFSHRKIMMDQEQEKFCRDVCSLSDLKSHHPCDRKMCFETSTFFDKKDKKVANLQERYNREVEYLRDRLKGLKNHAYLEKGESLLFPSEQGFTTSKAILADLKEEDSFFSALKIDPIVTNLRDFRKKGRRDRGVNSPPVLKTNKSRTALKANLRGRSKMKRRAKACTSASNLYAEESDFSGSDECADEDNTVNEEDSESVSDPSISEEGQNVEEIVVDECSGDYSSWPLRNSLFPYIPPYIQFQSHDAEAPIKVPGGRKIFKWKLSTITPVVVRQTLLNSGFSLVRKSNQWIGTWGKHMKSPMFKTLKETQKLNHFPGTFQLGRKDRLWRNFQRLIHKYGHKEFGFLPQTYILPQELKMLKHNWEYKMGNTFNDMWIIKPPASARGVGVKVINKWSHLPKKTSLVVQKYISNPYLINGSKFDLRLYVLVTSFNPLRIYLYPDGLARFASSKYSDDARDLKDRYMHLTNYSINKLSAQYTTNEDANACQGHKWTLSKLMEYLSDRGVDTKTLWKNLQQLVIKTIITAEAPITELCEENMNNYYNCYELFGVDVLLDEDLKPWLLEVNISPSLHSASPLDAHVKGPLVQTLFDMAQFHIPPKVAQTVRNHPPCFDPKLYTMQYTKKERAKHNHFRQYECRGDYMVDILKDLTGDDVRQLVRAEDEYVAKGKFERIFPTAQTYKYLNFMEVRYYNRLFDAWETRYGHKRQEGIQLLYALCSQKVHLKVPSQTVLSKNSQSMTLGDVRVPPCAEEEQSNNLEDILQKATITINPEMVKA